MPSTFDIVADIIVQSCHVPRETITQDTHLLTDLGIDSLDLLDVVSAVDEAFGVRVPCGAVVACRAHGRGPGRATVRDAGAMRQH